MANVKILVVEDEVIVAKDIADMLKSRGYDVPAIALSGEQAIEKTERIQPDLVLMDIVLKGDVDGIEAAEQIRRRFGIPVLYLTAYTDEQTVKRAKITEPFGYITKPFDMRELYTNIEMALYKHKAEKALQRSKQEWEKTFDAISDWIALTDLKGRILRTNRSGEDFTGISSAQIVGQSCCKLVHGSEEHIPGCPLQKMLHTRQRESTELKVPDANRWLIVTIDPVIDKEGNLIGAVHITRDITERKQAELSLKEAEVELKHTIEVVPGIIAKANAHTGYFTHCNPALSSILGFSSEEFLARPFIEFIHPDDRQSTINEVEKQLKGSPVAKFENRYICKDGFYKWLEWRATAADEKGVVYAAATDITERKKAEHALTESEEKYRRFYEDAPLGYQSLDASGNFLDVNKTWLNVLGYSKEEVIGRLFADFVAPESLETFVDNFPRFKESGQTRGTEFEMVRKDGSRITVSFDGNIEYDEEGRFRRTHCIMHNITERKKAEEALRESEEHYRMLTETMNDGLGQVDENGRYVYVNNKFGEMLGYSPDEMVGRHWTAFFDEDAQKIINEQLVERRKGISKPYELENTRKDGQKIFLRISPQAIFDTDNRYMGNISILTDITERKKAEEQIAKLAKFPAEDPNPVLRISGHGTVIYANKASLPLLRIWRCRVGQSLPNPWHEFVLDALSSGQSQQTEAKCDGRIFSLTFAPVVKANYVNVYGHDITERKKAEEMLLSERDRLISVFKAMEDGVYIVNQQYDIQYVNPVLTKDFGIYEGRKCYEYFHDRTEVCSWCKNEEVFAGKTVRWEWYSFKNQKTYDLIGTPLKNLDGSISKLEMFRDITKRKKAEEKLLEHQTKLKAMASEMLLTEERERQRLAVGLHDEVCQKLVLTKFALESSMQLVSDSKVLASLRIVCEGIGETIEQADSLTFELSNPVLRQLGFVIALEKYLTEEIRQKHGIAFELEGDEQLSTLPDEIKNCLFRVTRELLTNVVKHAQANKIMVSVRKSQSQIYVRVQDDGVGFKESQAGSKVSQTARFGLFSIREQLEYLGGYLEIESEPGRGTTATVVVPLRDKAVV